MKRMNQKEQFLNRLKSYVGYEEQQNGWTRFGQAYAERHHNPSFACADWCAMTIASVAREVGIPETVIPDYAACTHYLNWFEQRGQRTSSTEGALPGDLVFYEWDGAAGALDGPDHIGTVESVSCNDPDRQLLSVIEGNYHNRVARREIAYRDPRVWATCRPHYEEAASETYLVAESDTFTSIVHKTGLSPDDLARLNGWIQPGKAIVVAPSEPLLTPVLRFQQALLTEGYELPFYGADGVWGNETESAAQKALRSENSSDSLVRLAQELLLAQGCTLAQYGADGEFGAETRDAVLAFQKERALTEDGVIGPETWKTLLEV